jgi:hypothetical protein
MTSSNDDPRCETLEYGYTHTWDSANRLVQMVNGANTIVAQPCSRQFLLSWGTWTRTKND